MFGGKEMGCLHQMMLVNHGISWCELQEKCYPDCSKCKKHEAIPEGTITSTATSVITLAELSKVKSMLLRE